MLAAAEALEFERAASIRDRISKMRDSVGQPVATQARSIAACLPEQFILIRLGDP